MDVALGARIRLVREQAHIPATQIAAECGISFQQVQKYEQGSNRLSFSRLVEMADALGIGVVALIAPVVEEQQEPLARASGYMQWLQVPLAISMLEGFARLTGEQRRAVLAVVQAMALHQRD